MVNFRDELVNLLLEKNDDTDVSLTLNMPEQKFKRYASKFNQCIRKVYLSNKSKDVRLFHIILSLQDYFDMKWLVDNILDKKNKSLLEEETKLEYNVKFKKKSIRNIS